MKNIATIPRPFRPPVFGNLQYANMIGEQVIKTRGGKPGRGNNVV